MFVIHEGLTSFICKEFILIYMKNFNDPIEKCTKDINTEFKDSNKIHRRWTKDMNIKSMGELINM